MLTRFLTMMLAMSYQKHFLHRAGMLVLAVFYGYSVSQAGATNKIIDVRDALSDNSVVTVRGVITIAPNLSNHGEASRMQIQDDTAGISVVSQDHRLLTAELQFGDSVELTGTLVHVGGRPQIEIGQFQKVGSGARFAPFDVTISDLLGGKHVGQVVRLVGKLTVSAGEPDHVRLSDSSGQIQLVVPNRFFRNPDFAADFQNGRSVQVTGVVTKAQSRAPQILVQEASDMRFSHSPPYKAIATALLLLTGAALLLHLSYKRRSAERHSAEMAKVIDQLQRSERQLRQSEEKYRALFENASDLIYTLDLDGNITSVNAAAARLTGYSPDELVGSKSDMLLSPESLIVARQMKQRKLRGETQPTVFEADFIQKDGRRVVMELSSQLIRVLDVPVGIQTVARDVSERNRLQKELHQTRKMEAIGRIAGGVAHDFNNVLTIISGYATMLSDHSDSCVKKNASAIRKAVERATGLTSQLLVFGRKQVLQPKVLDLNQVIRGMEKLLPRLIREDILMSAQYGAELWPVEADPVQLEQIILNLVVNARDAMPDGGNLWVETVNVARCGHEQSLATSIGPYVALIVRDTGCGMNQDTLGQMFEPFFTTKAPGKGTGLGLSTVYSIVEQSGGHIHVQSEIGQGTTFEIHFPKTHRHTERPMQRVPTRQTGGETILLVEDEPELRQILKYYLTSCGYNPLEASDPVEALELCKKYSGSLDLLLTDVIMPKMNGPTLAQKAAEIRPKMKVLYMSGYTYDAIAHHDILKNNLNFIAKPFTPDSLCAKLRECLNAN